MAAVPNRGHIIIVDDDTAGAGILSKLLEQEGYDVERADGGSRLLKLVTDTEPNLVLLDANLSDTNPFALREKLRESPHWRDVPVIFLASRDDIESRTRGFE